LSIEKGELKMGNGKKGIHVSRRGFMKTAAMAGMAATLPVTGLAEQSMIKGIKPSPAGKKRGLLFLSSNPENDERLIESIKSIEEYEINVAPMKVDFKKPKEILRSIQEKNADILFIRLTGVVMSSRNIAEGLGTLDIPVILLPVNLDLIMWETDLAASFRIKETNALLADSEEHALELIRIVAAPRPLEGQRALIFGKPFASTSIPAPNLNEDYVYKRTGVRIEHRPIEELRELIKGIDKTDAKKEMERWKNGAMKIVRATDEMILNCSRMYVLLRSLVDQEGLSAISIDCLSFSFTPDTSIPLPCLAFTRLRDEGISAICEADVCMMLSSMVMQEICGRPSYQSNVSSVNTRTSSAVLRHCVAPTKIFGSDAPPRPYNILDYHGMGKGAVPEIEYPVGLEITMGGFSKDLKDFVLWPGRIQQGINDKDTPSFKNAPPEFRNMRKFCSNRAEIKIKDVYGFLRNIVGIHHIVVAGSHEKMISDAMMKMNVNVITPPDMIPPEV
jgi:L-fucose isomerase-like protein